MNLTLLTNCTSNLNIGLHRFSKPILFAVCYSCSNNESGFEEKSNEKSLIEQKFNASKFTTIGHNVM